MASSKRTQTAAAPQRVTFLVAGTRDGTRGAASASGQDEVVACILLASEARRDASGVPVERLEATVGEHVVRLVADNGMVLLLNPLTARDLLQFTAADRATDRADAPRGAGSPAATARGGDEVFVSARLTLPTADAGLAATRGWTDDLKGWVLDRFELLKPELEQGLASATAAAIVSWRDGLVTPGVYALQQATAPQPFQAAGIAPLGSIAPRPDNQPVLVLVHGTFVDTSSTFAKLWDRKNAPLLQALFNRYGQAVYALDHRTLGEDPFENALPLARALPEGAVVHLATHSRGGLVAEAMARLADTATLDDAALRAAFPDEDAALRDHARELHRLLRGKRIRIARIVRAACPARGTLLASGRLDLYLSVFSWLLGKAGAPWAAGITQFAQAVARQRTDPHMLPGLRAMVPESAFVHWLNSAVEQPVSAELRVVAGDLQPEGFISLVKTLVGDAFYQTDNDLVVNTSAMYGGAPREGGASFVLHQGGDASHFEYFSTPELVGAVVRGLTDDTPQGFQPIGPESWAGRDSSGVRGVGLGIGAWRPGTTTDDPGRPALVLLPGISGSTLDKNGKPLWVGWRLLGGLDKLAYDPGKDGITASGGIERFYGKLAEHMQRSHQVTLYAYDWRAPIPEAAQGLAARLTALLDARAHTGQPVRVLAHSMGGLVTRAVQLVDPELWARLMDQPQGRFVMLGTPNGGSWAPMQMLSDDDDFGRTLTAFGAPLSGAKARQMIAGFPGLISMQDGLLAPELKLDTREGWRALAQADLAQQNSLNQWHAGGFVGELSQHAMQAPWGIPEDALLQQARALRMALDAQRDALPLHQAQKMLLVVGRADTTPAGVEIVPNQGVRYLDAPEGGDGRVTHRNACLPNVATWQAGASHGDLPCLESAFAAYQSLLETGSTRDLPRFVLPTAESRGAGAAAAATAASAADTAAASAARRLPRARELNAAPPLLTPGSAAGPRPRGRRGQPRQAAPVAVTLVHGNLRHVDRTLFIGHYMSSTLSGTEKVVDEQIGSPRALPGTLGQALRLQSGHYPERVGMHQSFQRLPAQDGSVRPMPEAVVVGLGLEGLLTEDRLRHSVRLALLDWLQRLHEAACRARHEGRTAPEGRIAAVLLGSGGIGISPATSARAVVAAMLDANERTAEVGWPAISDLQLVELYLDRAAEAWQAVRQLAETDPRLALTPDIQRANGGKLRPLEGGYRGAAYDIVRVAGAGNGRIEFAMDSRRARSELRGHSTQLALVQELVRAAVPPAGDENGNVHRSQTPAALGRTLFQLLVPPAVEPSLMESTALQLDLDDGTAALPWELMDARHAPHDGRSPKPWALRSNLLRTLQVREERSKNLRDSQRDNAALVIGEPRVTDPRYGPLPAARREAEAVAEILGGAVTTSLGGDALEVISALHAQDWRLVHIAGHGYWGPRANQQDTGGGVVLSGDGIYLGPDEVCSLRCVPELVFVNCCYLGSLAPLKTADAKAQARFEHGTFAGGVAKALIAQGVRCVVAAGWPVGDAAGEIFARHFYGALRAGRNFGQAVGEARDATWQAEQAQGGAGTTWAAYQCYGDPAWTLIDGETATARETSLDEEYGHIATDFALKVALESLEVDARWEPSDRQRGLQRLNWLDEHLGPRYGHQGDVAEAFARAWLHANDTAKAIAWYRRACAAADGLASQNAQETLANQLVRLAYEGLRRSPGQAPVSAAEVVAALAQVDEGLALLQQLARQRQTSEAWCLVGSAWKRHLMVQQLHPKPPADRAAAALNEMRAAYTTALATLAAANAPESDQMYPLQNLLALGLRAAFVAKTAPAGAVRDDLLAKLARCRAYAEAPELPDEWQMAAKVELALQAALLGAGQDDLPAVMAQLETLKRRQPDPKVWRTLADQLDFLLPPHARAALRTAARPVKELLSQLSA